MTKKETFEKWGQEVVDRARSMYEIDSGKVFFPEDCKSKEDISLSEKERDHYLFFAYHMMKIEKKDAKKIQNKLQIIFWHGYSPSYKKYEKFYQKLFSICQKENKDYYFYGTIGEFADKWNDAFLYYPPNESHLGRIGITPYGNFGAI